MRPHGRPLRITDEQALALAERHRAGESIRQIAASIGVPKSTVATAIRGREYRRKEAAKQSLRKYGLSVSALEEMEAAQGGRCAICRKRKKLAVDHNHQSGQVRSLLCMNCNTGIGMFAEDPATLARAIVYCADPEGQE